MQLVARIVLESKLLSYVWYDDQECCFYEKVAFLNLMHPTLTFTMFMEKYIFILKGENCIPILCVHMCRYCL